MEPIRFASRPQLLLAGLLAHHEYVTAHFSVPRQWDAFRIEGPAAQPVGRDTFGAICKRDARSFEYLTAVEVASFDSLPTDCGRIILPAQDYAVFLHQGPVVAIGVTWAHVMQWLAAGEYESAGTPAFEAYGPDFDPTRPDSRVEIWVGVRRRAGRQVV